MSAYAIGDIHGCWETLQRLLGRIGWNADSDELWLVGDLVNRGPGSLEVLRWAVRNQSRITAVLGNHDLHLLIRAAGLASSRAEDTLDEVLAAPDRDELIGWLRRRPMVHHAHGMVMVHAGLWPGWDLDRTLSLAAGVAESLDGEDGGKPLLARLSAKPRPEWRPGVAGEERLAAAAAIFTRLRVVRADGRPRLDYTGSPEAAPEGCRPWFETSRVVRAGRTVIFGHWAMLGYHDGDGVRCLDSGCVYGGHLSALRIGDGASFHEPVADEIPPVEE
jgi:bis(5'-nucleosyl)-tetraphosphatase (symmetrical)